MADTAAQPTPSPAGAAVSGRYQFGARGIRLAHARRIGSAVTHLSLLPQPRHLRRASVKPLAPLVLAASPWLALVAGGVGGLALGLAGPAHAAPDGGLALLLRFMAALKGAAVLGAAVLLGWRLRAPIAGRTASGYLAALAVAALAPGLIATLHHVVAGALCFHGGLLGFGGLALADEFVASIFRTRRP